MNGDRWQRVSALFDAALDLAPDLRQALLDRARRDDPEVAADVQSLLAAHLGAGSFLDGPGWAALPGGLDESSPQAPGNLVGPYRIIAEIGRGGMGIVYEAEDQRLGRRVALKVLPRGVARDPVRRLRLGREARAAAALSHPAIATVFAFEQIQGDLVIASEIVRGTTLREEVSRGPLPAAQVLETAIAMAEALDAAARQGIVHRDLKPENVIRRNDGQIKVLDFGLAQQVPAEGDETRSRLTAEGFPVGTPGYMAPEQLRGNVVDARADIFAFGVVACEMATGRHPFGADDPAELLARMLDGQTPALPAIDPPELDAIVRRCLRRDPGDRYPSPSALLADLRALSDGSAPRVSEAPSSMPVPRRARALWWWQFHQAAVTAFIVSALWPIWLVRAWLPRGAGSIAFLTTLVLVAVIASLRLHLWFVAHVHASDLWERHRGIVRWMVSMESALAILLVATGIALAGAHDGYAAWCLGAGAVIVVSLIAIEPATERAARD